MGNVYPRKLQGDGLWMAYSIGSHEIRHPKVPIDRPGGAGSPLGRQGPDGIEGVNPIAGGRFLQAERAWGRGE